MYININRYRSYLATLLMSIFPDQSSQASRSCSSESAVILGVEDCGTELIIWFNNPYGWTDVHYKLNGAGLESIRLVSAGGSRKEKVIPVSEGGPIKLVYSFTHATATGATSTVDYTFERLVNGSANSDPNHRRVITNPISDTELA